MNKMGEKIVINNVVRNLFLIVGVLLIGAFSFGIVSSSGHTGGFYGGATNTWQTYQPNFNELYGSDVGTYWPVIENMNNDQCNATSDFLVMIPPGGCSPSVVRSDLLEEQNVPVFCQLQSIQINPLIKVSSIKSISFKGEYPEGVSGISFHPARAATRSYRTLLGNPTINNIGYVVIVLKRNKIEKNMEDWIAGNLTATIRYDAEEAYGVGRSSYYLPIMSEDEWEKDYAKTAFWKGKGYLRLMNINRNSAEIDIYHSKDQVSRKINLQEGQTSEMSYFPGYYCRAGMKVKLNKIVSPEDMVLLNIDGEESWVRSGSRILNNRCTVRSLTVNDDESGSVKIDCSGGSLLLSTSLKDENSLKNSFEELPDPKNYFDKTIRVTKELVDEYPLVSKGELSESYAEETLIEQIDLAGKYGQLETKKELLDLFVDTFPQSSSLELIRRQSNLISDYDFGNAYGNIIASGKYYSVSISEFSKFKSDSKKVSFKIGNEIFSDRIEGSEEIVDGGKFIVTKISPGEVTFSFTGSDNALNVRGSRSVKIREGESGALEGRNIYVQNIDMELFAYVSLIPEVKRTKTEADFTFKVGVEKRAIQLSTEKTEEKLKNIEKSIESWEKVNDRLGKTIKAWKGACFATSSILMLKNVASGVSGVGLARQKVMSKYKQTCDIAIGNEEYRTRTECYNDLSEQIDKDVETMADTLKSVNEVMDKSIDKHKKDGGIFGEDRVIDQEAYVNDLKKELGAGWSREVDGVELAVEDLTSSSQVRAAILVKKLESKGGIPYETAIDELDISLKNLALRKSLGSGSNNLPQSTNSCSNVWPMGTAKVHYYESGSSKGLPAIVPFDLNDGWYAMVPNSGGTFLEDSPKGFADSGAVNYFKICNIGKNGLMERGTSDDSCQSFDVNSVGVVEDFLSCPELSPRKVKSLYTQASGAIREASRQYGEKNINIFGNAIALGNPASNTGEVECQDFMSPDDCKLMFNTCDPVVCPSSRCDFGGKMPVADVIQTGIVGGVLMCLPNSKEGIAVPLCLSGIHAGIDTFTSILKSEVSCLEKSLETGEHVGICDEITSIYKCEFFWKQAAPVLKFLGPKILEDFTGNSRTRGGGEYLLIQNAFDNLDKSFSYFKNIYAPNAFRAFQIRNIEEVGGEFCKAFIGTSVPSSADALDSLLEPESPPQFFAYFSEDTFTDVTVPATSQYNVYYHIYAGNDKGRQFRVYLKNPPASGYYSTNPTIEVQTGYIAKGTSADESKDFTAPAGYKELCVVIDNQEECGFRQVSTDLGINMVQDAYVSDQASQTDITTENECISGKPLTVPSFSLNLGAIASNAIDPEISKRGLVRICASGNPETTSRWKEVGYCGNTNLKCWLDTESVKDSLNTLAIANDADLKSLGENFASITMGSMTPKEIQANLRIFEKEIKDLQVGGFVNDTEWKNVRDSLDIIIGAGDSPGVGSNLDKAKALWLKAKLYQGLVLSKIGIPKQISVDPGRQDDESGKDGDSGEDEGGDESEGDESSSGSGDGRGEEEDLEGVKGISYELGVDGSEKKVYYHCYAGKWSFSLDNANWNLINRDNVIESSQSSNYFKGSSVQVALNLGSKDCNEGSDFLKDSDNFVKSYETLVNVIVPGFWKGLFGAEDEIEIEVVGESEDKVNSDAFSTLSNACSSDVLIYIAQGSIPVYTSPTNTFDNPIDPWPRGGEEVFVCSDKFDDAPGWRMISYDKFPPEFSAGFGWTGQMSGIPITSDSNYLKLK